MECFSTEFPRTETSFSRKTVSSKNAIDYATVISKFLKKLKLKLKNWKKVKIVILGKATHSLDSVICFETERDSHIGPDFYDEHWKNPNSLECIQTVLVTHVFYSQKDLRSVIYSYVIELLLLLLVMVLL